ncbi:MAG TPA: methyltransferase domain-containing protein [Tepidisphaeraceae bacterium]|nr:methyltransferase domain-containing protein [Tepidisphaeraceae bacterium]
MAGSDQQQAAYYNAYWSGADGWKPTDRLDEELRRWLTPLIRRGDRMLDVGCGDGSRYAEYLLDAGVELHGTDISDVAVKSANQHGLRAVMADLGQPLPFSHGFFDSIVCLEVFEHLLNPEYTAAEICRVLRKGGKLLVSVPNAAAWRNRMELLVLGRFNPTGSPQTSRRFPWRDPHIRFFNNRSLGAMLSEVGFAIDKQGGLDVEFLSCAPGLRRAMSWRWMHPARVVTRQLGRRFYSLLAGRCAVLATRL